jgi:hypothetical protein
VSFGLCDQLNGSLSSATAQTAMDRVVYFSDAKSSCFYFSYSFQFQKIASGPGYPQTDPGSTGF